MVIGIDVATDRLNCVALEADGSPAEGRVYAAREIGALTAWAAQATVIAIDAPADLSTEPHAAEDALPPQFRRARCAEIALGRDHGIWVPWTSPTGPPAGAAGQEDIGSRDPPAHRRTRRGRVLR